MSETWSWMWSVKGRLFFRLVVLLKPHGAERSSWSLLPYVVLKVKLSGVHTTFLWLFRHHKRSKSGYKYSRYVIYARSKSKPVLVCAHLETIDGIQLNKYKCMSVFEIFIGVIHAKSSLIITVEEWVLVGCYSSHLKVLFLYTDYKRRLEWVAQIKIPFFSPVGVWTQARWIPHLVSVVEHGAARQHLHVRAKSPFSGSRSWKQFLDGCPVQAGSYSSGGDLAPKSVLMNT